jgi:hypothetical protein
MVVDANDPDGAAAAAQLRLSGARVGRWVTPDEMRTQSDETPDEIGRNALDADEKRTKWTRNLLGASQMRFFFVSAMFRPGRNGAPLGKHLIGESIGLLL